MFKTIMGTTFGIILFCVIVVGGFFALVFGTMVSNAIDEGEKRNSSINENVKTSVIIYKKRNIGRRN